jgi:hypothetical protein
VFVTKLNPSGSALLYATYLGGTEFEEGFAIAVDPIGNAYVTGLTASADFPTTPGAFDTTFNGSNGNVFVTKINPTGSAMVYSTHLDGEFGLGIAVDSAGNAYVTGDTFSPTFPTTAGAFDTTYNGGGDAFVTKLDPSGSTLVYSTYLGGSSFERGHGIAVDSAGSAYVTGFVTSLDFPTTPGAFDTTFNGVHDAFVAKLDPSGSALVYSTYLGGSDQDIAWGIAIDSAGNAYVTGETRSPNFPTTPAAFDTELTGLQDAFVAKLGLEGRCAPKDDEDKKDNRGADEDHGHRKCPDRDKKPGGQPDGD